MAELFCDICGKGQVRAQIQVEGAKLLACASCMKSGKILHRFQDEDEGGGGVVAERAPSPELGGGEEIADDWGKIIKAARDRAHLPLAVVAERINEKESYLDAIETGRLMPSLQVARKLEKELGVRLVERSGSSVAPSAAAAPSRLSAPTLADMLSKGRENRKKGK